MIMGNPYSLMSYQENQEVNKLVDEDKLERLYNGVYFLPYLTSDGKRVCLYFWNICIHCISICWRNYFFNFCTSKYR